MIGIAVLIKTKSDDGLFEIKDDTLLGKEYFVDLESKRVARGYNTIHRIVWKKEIINVVDYDGRVGWLPTELLEIEKGFV